MGSLTTGERWAVFWLLVGMLVFAVWSALGKWKEAGGEVEPGVEVDWAGEG